MSGKLPRGDNFYTSSKGILVLDPRRKAGKKSRNESKGAPSNAHSSSRQIRRIRLYPIFLENGVTIFSDEPSCLYDCVYARAHVRIELGYFYLKDNSRRKVSEAGSPIISRAIRNLCDGKKMKFKFDSPTFSSCRYIVAPLA